MLVDTHAHINFETYDGDRVDMLKRAKEAGLGAIICIGMCAEGGRSALALAREHAGFVYASVGVHPYDAALCDEAMLAAMEELLREPEMRLCGEMGIDRCKCDVPLERQRRAFSDQLQLATRMDKPVCIHCRDAFDDVMSVLDEVGPPPRGGFAHCFSDGPVEARQWVKRGFKVSFAGQVTFKNADKLREAARALSPQDCVIETDCPFLAPVPNRGKRNEPAFIIHTAAALAEVWRMDHTEVVRITGENARSVLGLMSHDCAKG